MSVLFLSNSGRRTEKCSGGAATWRSCRRPSPWTTWTRSRRQSTQATTWRWCSSCPSRARASLVCTGCTWPSWSRRCCIDARAATASRRSATAARCPWGARSATGSRCRTRIHSARCCPLTRCTRRSAGISPTWTAESCADTPASPTRTSSALLCPTTFKWLWSLVKTRWRPFLIEVSCST